MKKKIATDGKSIFKPKSFKYFTLHTKTTLKILEFHLKPIMHIIENQPLKLCLSNCALHRFNLIKYQY